MKMNRRTSNGDFNSKDQEINPAYQWLEKARQLYSKLDMEADSAAIHGIVAEGKARLDKINKEDAYLASMIRLAIAEGLFNLALEEENPTNLSRLISEGRCYCEEAANAAIEENCGVACEVLPRAVTLLASIYRAVPQARQPVLEKSLKIISAELDNALLEQQVLRELANDKEQEAYLLITDYEGLSKPDRGAILIRVTELLLSAGELLSQAGDMDSLALVQSDLEAIQKSLLDEDLPAPILEVFKKKTSIDKLLPEGINAGMGPEGESQRVPANEVPGRSEKRRSPLRWVLSIGGMLISCAATLFSGYNLLSGMMNREPTMDSIAAVQTENAVSLTEIAISFEQTNSPQDFPVVETEQPVQEQPIATEEESQGPSLSGAQEINDHYLFDDFSSEALGWPVVNDGSAFLQYENQAYSVKVNEPDKTGWVNFPVSFIPYEINFDVFGLPGTQDGTFGVFCQLQDADNFYYVEMDLQTHDYVISEVSNGEYIPLTIQNSSGQYWHPIENMQALPESTNHISVSCYLDSINLSVNDALIDSVSVTNPFDQPGEAGLLVYAYDFASDTGYKVFFDNVEIWQPVQ